MLKRIAAFFIDYCLIAAYASFLFFVSGYLLGTSAIISGPVQGELLGFVTLTLPVFLYFFLSENGKSRATIGKRLLRLSVVAPPGKTFSVLKRNLLKFLPWEVAHVGVHWVVHYSSKGLDTPLWVWVVLIVPQLVVAFYVLTIVLTRGQGSFYDKAAGTMVISRSNS